MLSNQLTLDDEDAVQAELKELQAVGHTGLLYSLYSESVPAGERDRTGGTDLTFCANDGARYFVCGRQAIPFCTPWLLAHAISQKNSSHRGSRIALHYWLEIFSTYSVFFLLYSTNPSAYHITHTIECLVRTEKLQYLPNQTLIPNVVTLNPNLDCSAPRPQLRSSLLVLRRHSGKN